MPLSLHLIVLLVSGLALTGLSRPLGWRGLLGVAASVLLPVPLVWALGTDEAWITGGEGLIEALTEGVLLSIVLRAGWHRQPWMLAGALVLLLEELDYGQLLLGFETPGWVQALPSRSTRFNLHNLPGSGLWRVGPGLGMALLGLRPAASVLDRLRLPRFERRVWAPLLLSLALVFPTVWLAGERRGNESAELAWALLAALAWRPVSRPTGPAAPDPSGGTPAPAS